MRILRGEVLTAGLMSALFGFMVLNAFRFPEDARLLPLLAGVPGLLLSLLVMVAQLRKEQIVEVDAKAQDQARATVRKEIELFGWFALFTIGMLLLGVLLSSLLVVFLFLVVQQREPLLGAALFSIGCAVTLYLMFEQLLGLPLFEGFGYIWLFE